MKLILSIVAFLALSLSALSADSPSTPAPTPPTTSSPAAPAAQPFDEIFKQNYVDLTNWIKDTANPAAGGLIKEGAAFTKEQTPLFIRDYIRWQIWGNLIFPVLGTVALFVVIHYARKSFAVAHGKDGETAACVTLTMVALVLGVGLALEGTYELKNSVKAMVAPRVVIVEKITELVKR